MSFFSIRKDNPHQSIANYAQTPIVRSARFDDNDGRYHYARHGQHVACGGLVKTLEYRFYPKYKDSKRRRAKGTRVRGSNKKQGKLIDSQLLQYVQVGKKPKRCSNMTTALLDYWHNKGHTLEASQLPVELSQWNKMTQADIVTSTKNGELHLWEVKTGFPVGGYREQKEQPFFSAPLHRVPCTKYNIWQLQLHYTKQGLIEQGLPIAHAHVIQVYSKDRKLEVKVREQEPWLKDAPKQHAQHKPVVL